MTFLIFFSCAEQSKKLAITEINPEFRDQILNKNFLMPVQFFEIQGYAEKQDSTLVKAIKEYSLEHLDTEMLIKFGYHFQDFYKPTILFDYTIDDMKEAARGDPPVALRGDHDRAICYIIYRQSGKQDIYSRSIMVYKKNYSKLDTTLAYREYVKITFDSVELIEEVPYY